MCTAVLFEGPVLYLCFYLLRTHNGKGKKLRQIISGLASSEYRARRKQLNGTLATYIALKSEAKSCLENEPPQRKNIHGILLPNCSDLL